MKPLATTGFRVSSGLKGVALAQHRMGKVSSDFEVFLYVSGEPIIREFHDGGISSSAKVVEKNHSIS